MSTSKESYSGLTSHEAGVRLNQTGPNQLESSKPRSVFSIAVDTVREPMFLLLLACSLLYLALGDLGEALILSSAIFVVMFITFVQERRTERTLDALRDLSSPRALVMRDGVPLRIAGKDVVPDDLVLIQEGDRIPADGFVLMSTALKIDESLLTGESVPVGKIEWNGKDSIGQAGGEDTPFVYSGTLVVQGSGSVKIQATGRSTAMGRIGSSLSKTTRPSSVLQEDTRRVVRVVAFSSLAVSVAMALVWWLRNGELLRGILMGLTFAMSTIPEEFPVVLTIFMALGAWRISKQKVLTRQMNAIESLGSATILCVDKTGTLTENRMTVAALWTVQSGPVKIASVTPTLPQDCVDLIRIAALASDRSGNDPMDLASVAVTQKFGITTSENLKLIKSFPLIRPLLAVGFAWSNPQDNSLQIAIKGAPEAALKLSGVPQDLHKKISDAMLEMAAQGLRVLGVGISNGSKASPLPNDLSELSYEFLGLVGFSDPVKAGVPEAVAQCHSAGIKVMMITGDYPVTALSVAREIGLENSLEVLTGSELSSMPDDLLQARLKIVRVLARMIPEQKLRIVQLLRDAGEIVAMTGDGVNDAPALKAAHIGIAMGGRGTDVAREAAALVLLNDDFTSIVAAIRLGRRIYDNIQKAITYIIAIHIPIVGLTLVPFILGMPPILLPVHLAFLELIIDPVCSILFEAESEEASIMNRLPRSAGARLFSKSVVTSGMFEGLFVFAAAMAVYLTIGQMGQEPNHARAVSFTTLVFANVFLILSLRSKTEPAWKIFERPNPALPWISLALFCLSAAVLYVPALIKIFHFAPPHGRDVIASAAAAALSLVGFEIAKLGKARLKRGGI